MTFRQRPEISEGESHMTRWSRNVPEGSNTREETEAGACLEPKRSWSLVWLVWREGVRQGGGEGGVGGMSGRVKDLRFCRNY